MHLLSTQRLNAMEPLRMKKVEELMSFINKCCEREEAVDIARAFFVTALNIISNALFSTDFATHDSKSSHEYHNTVISLMNVTGKPNVGDYFPFLRFLDLQGTRKEATLCTQRLFKVFQDFMNARMAKKSSHTKDISSFDMLDTLLDLTQENKAELSLNDIKHFLQAQKGVVAENMDMTDAFGVTLRKAKPLLVITSPEAAREVLRTHDQVLSNRGSNNSINSINHQELSLVWAPSSSLRWRLLRKLSATMLFSPQRMEATKALRMNKVKDLISFMSESSEREKAVDISHALFTTTLNIISNILFSVDLGSYDPFKKLNGFQDTVIGVMEAIGNPDAANYFPFLRFLDLQGNSKKMKDNIERLFRVFRGFIDAKIAEKALLNNPKDVTDGDFVDALLHLTEGDEAELNTNDIEHFLSDLFTAGTDTSSSTVQWAMAELLSNPKTMKKAQAEMDHLPNGINPEDLDMDETFGLTLHKTKPLHAIPIMKRPIN
ncbi:hypothetical protein Bca52824_044551 [Brassica carinata]|uniref:Uncharacterized protein n=1 Tax=Brassica carinata TaxID=52824 RepID=A0A8X7RBE4_BRACI|nr:hypothetical protein Bca52824_044551 [Brassica carinata]